MLPSLQDCLACSGCVTSAETVLLEHQSIGELRAKLQVPLARIFLTLLWVVLICLRLPDHTMHHTC